MESWVQEFRAWLGSYKPRVEGWKLNLNHNQLSDDSFTSILKACTDHELSFVMIQVRGWISVEETEVPKPQHGALL